MGNAQQTGMISENLPTQEVGDGAAVLEGILGAFNAPQFSGDQRNSKYLRGRIKSQEDAYAAIDALLKRLQKEHKNAKAQYTQAREMFGEDDPMLEVLADRLDSARSAVETRLLEVKANPKQAARGLQIWARVEDELEDKAKREKERKRQREIELFNNWYSFSRVKKKGLLGWLWIFLILYLLNQQKQNAPKRAYG